MSTPDRRVRVDFPPHPFHAGQMYFAEEVTRQSVVFRMLDAGEHPVLHLASGASVDMGARLIEWRGMTHPLAPRLRQLLGALLDARTGAQEAAQRPYTSAGVLAAIMYTEASPGALAALRVAIHELRKRVGAESVESSAGHGYRIVLAADVATMEGS